MKVFRRPIEVRFSDGRPVGLRLNGHWCRVRRVLDLWRETGRWWEGEKEKQFLRVEAGGIHVIYRAVGQPGTKRATGGVQPRPPATLCEHWFLLGSED